MLQTKKVLISIGLLSLGIVLGWLLFGDSTNGNAPHDHNESESSSQLWTCSMDPQVMQPEFGSCPICGMDLIPAESNGDGLSANEFQLTENAMELANIQTTVVGEEFLGSTVLKLSGKIIENETTQKVQISYFSGRIERLFVRSVGERIFKGQRLATIYSPELIAAQQELLVTSALKETQPELYKAVKKKLEFWKLTSDQIDTIERSGNIFEYFTVYATVSGVVLKKMVSQGNQITQGQALFALSDLQTVWANFDVYENQIPLFQVGQQLSIRPNTNTNQSFDGEVSFIDPVLNTKSRTAGLRVTLTNKEGLLKPGMFVEGFFDDPRTKEKSNQMTIPAAAVLWTGEQSLVYVKTDKNTPVFEMRNVILGDKVGAFYQIKGGLEVGEEVVTNGSFTLDAAAQLKGVKSMMQQSKPTESHGGHQH